MFLAGAIQITEICTHERAGRGHLARIRQEIDVKMRDAARRRWHFPPTVSENPANESTGALVVTGIARERAKPKYNILLKSIKLIQQWFARTKEIAAQLSFDIENKGRFRFVIGVISR